MASSNNLDFGIRVVSASLSNGGISSFLSDEVNRTRFTIMTSAIPITSIFIVYKLHHYKTSDC